MIKPVHNYGCIILAGGKSSRLGKDKGSLMIGNKKMVSHVIDTVKSIGITDILLITNQPELYKEYENIIHQDIIKDVGPMGGIYSGLKFSKHEFNLVLACDAPLVDEDIIQLLLNQFESPISILSFRDKQHPLIGIYSKSIINHLESEIHNNRLRLVDCIKDLNGKIIPVEKYAQLDETNVFTNVNTVEDLNNLNNLLSS